MRIVQFLFVSLFLAAIAAPVAEWMSGYVDISALEEKRTLTKLPDFKKIVIEGDGRLSAAINQWFDDHYGFRALLVRLKNQLDYWVFRYSDKIAIGQDGWLYQPVFFTNLVRAERSGDEGANNLHAQYRRLADYLAARNIRLVVVSNPDKENIYPQYLPIGVPQLPADNHFEKLRKWLKSQNDLIYVDGEDILREKCRGLRTFHKIDIHMTFPGGVCFVRELVDRVAAAEGRTASPWRQTFTYTEVEMPQGGQADFLSLLFPVTSTNFAPNPIFGQNEPGFSTDPSGVYEWVYEAPAEERDGRLPGIVLFGDSFLDHYRGVGISNYFTEVRRARDVGSNLATVLQALPTGTRYFVFQFLEPYLAALGAYAIPDATPPAADGGARVGCPPALRWITDTSRGAR